MMHAGADGQHGAIGPQTYVAQAMVSNWLETDSGIRRWHDDLATQYGHFRMDIPVAAQDLASHIRELLQGPEMQSNFFALPVLTDVLSESELQWRAISFVDFEPVDYELTIFHCDEASSVLTMQQRVYRDSVIFGKVFVRVFTFLRDRGIEAIDHYGNCSAVGALGGADLGACGALLDMELEDDEQDGAAHFWIVVSEALSPMNTPADRIAALQAMARVARDSSRAATEILVGALVARREEVVSVFKAVDVSIVEAFSLAATVMLLARASDAVTSIAEEILEMGGATGLVQTVIRKATTQGQARVVDGEVDGRGSCSKHQMSQASTRYTAASRYPNSFDDGERCISGGGGYTDVATDDSDRLSVLADCRPGQYRFMHDTY